jgi:hypothetical protein
MPERTGGPTPAQDADRRSVTLACKGTLVTNNRDTAEWLAAFDDTLLAQSAIDRFQDAAYTLVIKGESYRSGLKSTVDRAGPPPRRSPSSTLTHAGSVFRWRERGFGRPQCGRLPGGFRGRVGGMNGPGRSRFQPAPCSLATGAHAAGE